MSGLTADEEGVITAAPGNPRVTAVAAWFLLASWLLATAGAFWYFELGAEPLVGTTMQSFALAARAPVEAWYREHVAAPDARLTVVRLHAPHCACDRAITSESEKIEARFQARGVRFLDTADGRLRKAGVTAAPAALIFDAEGHLIYYGPLGASAWCATSGGMLESVLERALQGSTRFTSAPVTRGCFCTG